MGPIATEPEPLACAKARVTMSTFEASISLSLALLLLSSATVMGQFSVSHTLTYKRFLGGCNPNPLATPTRRVAQWRRASAARARVA